MVCEDILDKAYKKLKSSVYYDKTNLILRDKIVDFESSHNQHLKDYLHDLWISFVLGNSAWERKKQEILSQIDVKLLPKKVKQKNNEATNAGTTKAITNFVASREIVIEEIQYFIDMPIEGHILGILWVFLVGWKLDQGLRNCYGNRIRKKLYKDSSLTPTYSPYLFEPYFQNYESWRDTALEKAQEYLKQGDDVLIMSLDFKRFFYSVDITEEFMENLLQTAERNYSSSDATEAKRINEFIMDVIRVYHDKISHYDSSLGNVLPIGFIPSNILANCCLQNFDNAVTAGWSPLYYGRYVDDVLIVDRVEESSPIFQEAHSGALTIDRAISYYLAQGNHWPHNSIANKYGKAVLQKSDTESYRVLPEYTHPLGQKTNLLIQDEKAKVFYFDTNNTDAMIACFREKISKSKSEFRRMPEDDSVFQKDDYQSIFELEQGGINKFRDVEGVSLDKFYLSKYLGKYQRICGLTSDVPKAGFIQNISKIFTPTAIIENYILWEKVFTILVTKEAFEDLKKFKELIQTSIDEVKYPGNEMYTRAVKIALEIFLDSGLARALSLYWTNDNLTTLIEEFSFTPKVGTLAQEYSVTRMSDKSMFVVWPELLLKYLQKDPPRKVYHLNCTSPQQVYTFLSECYSKFEMNLDWKTEEQYIYYPYMVTMYDLSLSYQLVQMCPNHTFLRANDTKWLCQKYVELNYRVPGSSKGLNITSYEFEADENFEGEIEKRYPDNRVFCVGRKILSKIRVAISNIKMEDDSFDRLIQGKPNRSYTRYQKISRLVNEAITQRANFLVMPEACLPYEWLPTLARTCARNQLAIVTGVEHMIQAGNVYNMTAIILPFETDEYYCAQIFFHHKNHFAPNEKRLIQGYRLKPAKGSGYELYRWNDFYFSVYCCYELASIHDRAIFQSYVDALVAVEWNHDVNYYSNIIESLSRDIHCYCIQVNSSDYGDSRVTIPSKTERKDILRTKGGEFPTVLVATIDIEKLRNFQLKEYELQKDDKSFKPTPPEFDVKVTEGKIRHTLYENV